MDQERDEPKSSPRWSPRFMIRETAPETFDIHLSVVRLGSLNRNATGAWVANISTDSHFPGITRGEHLFPSFREALAWFGTPSLKRLPRRTRTRREQAAGPE